MSDANENKQLGVILGSRVFGGGVEVPGDMVNADFWKRVILYQFIYSMFGIVAGLACVVLGLILIVNGVVSDGHWSADVLGVRLTDASPGIVLFVVGLLLPRVTAFSVTTQKLPGAPPK